jgi:hypothetical protein
MAVRVDMVYFSDLYGRGLTWSTSVTCMAVRVEMVTYIGSNSCLTVKYSHMGSGRTLQIKEGYLLNGHP